MAGNKVLQILRGNNSTISSSTDKLLPGQPLYNVDRKYLIVGDGSDTQIQNADPITTNRLVSYNGDDSVASIQSDNEGDLNITTINKLNISSKDISIITNSGFDFNSSNNKLSLTGNNKNIYVDADLLSLSGNNTGDISVKGDITSSSLTTNSLTVNNNTQLQTLDVSGTSTFSGGLQVTNGSTTLKDTTVSSLKVTGSATAEGSLVVKGGANISGGSGLTATSLTVTSTASISGKTTCGSLAVTGNTTLNSVTTTGNVTLGNSSQDNHVVNGNITINGNVSANSFTSVKIGSWTIEEVSGKLRFYYDSSNYIEFTGSSASINVVHS